MAEIKSILQKIQAELKAPKGQFNKFGNYKYRSCEDILEAVKPLLAKYGAVITLGDDLVYLEGRFYVKATATMISETEKVCVSAFAREPEDKKGMDASQITGTASSYARKYALNGLLLIDDTKDEDSNELHEEKMAKEEQKAITSQPQRRAANKDKNPQGAPESAEEIVKAEEDMTKPTDIIGPVHVKAVRDRIKKAAEKGKTLEESALCKMLKIEKLEDMNFEQFRWFTATMEKSGV